MTDKIYCSQCAYCVPSTVYIAEVEKMRYAKCHHPAASGTNKSDRFVSPLLDVPPEPFYCSTMRSTECGEDAKLFELHQEAAA